MEDKLFELMSKMYADMKEQLTKINEKLDSKADKTDIIKIEDKLDANSKALFDGYKQTYEKLTTLEEKVDNISSKVENQEIELRVIRGGK